MLSEIVSKARQISGGEDGWSSLRLRGYNNNKSQKAFFADEVIKLIEAGNIRFSVSESKDIVLAAMGDCTLAITRNTRPGGRYMSGTVSFYELIIFKDGNEIFSLTDRCDNGDYDDSSSRVPVMDIYDVATTGKVRRPRTAHVCGASGFGQSLSDSCPACEGK